jgi:hypothetical protein
MVSKMIYFGYYSEMIQEGGQARNNAFWRYFSVQRKSKQINLNVANAFVRKINMLYFWMYLYFLKKNTVFIHKVEVL